MCLLECSFLALAADDCVPIAAGVVDESGSIITSRVNTNCTRIHHAELLALQVRGLLMSMKLHDNS